MKSLCPFNPTLLRGGAWAVLALLLGAVLAASPARADVIWGCWSLGEERIEIEPTGVVTPGGARPEAVIDPHGAAYIAPGGERDAGFRITFRQLNEELVARRVDNGLTGAAAMEAVEYWTPCEAPLIG